MADTDLDGGLTNGTPASPNAGGSEGQGDSGNSFDASKLQTTIESLMKRLDEVDARSKALQGDKDRAVNKASAEIDDLKRKFAEIEKLKKAGLNEDDAFTELKFRDEIREVREKLSSINPAQPSPAGNGNGLAVEQAKVLSEYGLDGNDPEVIEKVLKQPWKSPAELENLALKVAYKRATSSPPSPAASTSVQGVPAGMSDTASLVQKLGEMQRTPSKYRKEIAEITAKLDARGWK